MKTPLILLLALFPLTGSHLNADDEVKPFKGKAHAIPGLIEAEHYDEGPAGKAYGDSDERNRGENYRGETQVDIEKRPDASNGHGIGWIRAGEWQVYTVEVAKTGIYRVEIPVASKKKGGTFHLEIDGKDVTGAIQIPDTGGWDKLKTVKAEGVKLEKGTHQMKVVMDKNGDSGGIGDIDCYTFVETS